MKEVRWKEEEKQKEEALVNYTLGKNMKSVKNGVRKRK